MTRTKWSVSTTGTDSADNTVVISVGIVSGTIPDPNNCQVTIDGTLCNSSFEFYTGRGCFEVDCRNVKDGEILTCDDQLAISLNTSHPFYKALNFAKHCAFVSEPVA